MPLLSLTNAESLRIHRALRSLHELGSPYRELQIDRDLIGIFDCPEEPLWRKLSEEQQEDLAVNYMDQISDCAKDFAHDILDGLSEQELRDELDEPSDGVS